MKSFDTFFTLAEDTASQRPKRVSDDVVTTFGRHNPPHLGHKLGLDMATDIASNIGDKNPADQRFYTSHSQDRKQNPLPRDVKMKFLKKMFPRHKDKWDDDDQVKTVLQAAGKAHKDGFKNFHFVGGGDRRETMENLLRKYNGQLYDFKNIYSHSAGERGEDDPIGKLSASGQRRFAQNGDFEKFKEGMKFNSNFNEKDARELMKMVQMFGMKNEDWEIDQRGNKDYLRELYVAGQLYKEGDLIESLVTGLTGKVHRCGANHLICVTEDNIMFKTFVHEVHALQ